MLLFLGNIIEQLDLALEHLHKGDANNARFALMLSDNVTELMLHQVAKDQNNELKQFSYLQKEYPHKAALQRALGRYFDAKIKFAKMIGKLSEETAETLSISHTFRNEVYHIGLQHEAILASVAAFHIKVVSDVLARYSPPYLSWGSNQRLPERAKKYLTDRTILFPDSTAEYQAACQTLGTKAAHDDRAFAEALAIHMSETIDEKDEYIDYISKNAPHRETRDEVVIGCQTWPLAFSEEGKKFAQSNGWSGGNMLAFIDWLAKSYPLHFKGDPIPSWKGRAAELATELNPHKALKKYRTFMDETAELREQLDEATRHVDNYIDSQIEQMREQHALRD
jgi:hypothetical protein